MDGLRITRTSLLLARAAHLAAVALILAASQVWGETAGAGSENEVRRLLTLLAAVAEEYREGVRDGSIVRPVEFEEAKTFLQDAQQRFEASTASRLGGAEDLVLLFGDAADAIDQKAPVATVAAKLTTLRERMVAATGVSEPMYPPEPPSAARGKSLFAQYCVSCHGERGDGRGPSAAALNPTPASFTDLQFMRGETPYDFYHVISLGTPHTAMPAWGDVLSLQSRWDLVSYLWMLAPGTAGLVEGQGVYLAHCANCHGATGNGPGVFSRALLQPAPNLSQPQVLARRTDAELFAVVSDGTRETPMPSFRHSLRDDERWRVVAFVRALSLGGPPVPTGFTLDGGPQPAFGSRAATRSAGAPTAAGASEVVATLDESGRLLDAAVAAYRRSDRAAGSLASDAYLQFEPLEPRLGASDLRLKARVEERFLHLRQKMRSPGSDADVHALAAEIREDLTAVRTALEPHTSSYALLIESATIILREGFEVVLVIGALTAYLVKTGNQAMRRAVYGGAVTGVVASLATAYVMGRLVNVRPGSSDLLEGVTMLLAAVVLFWVSYWLISKAEADRWQRYIRGKVQTALSSGRGLALAGAAFLAVYREGFETVLFYQALYTSAPAGSMTVAAGFAVGAVALSVVYILFKRFEVRLPIRQFFVVTGLFLYGMAAIFAGQGIHELQESGFVGMTPVPGVPAIPLFGVYPSLQSLAVQGVFVALLMYATVITLRRTRRAAAAQDAQNVAEELRAVRDSINALRLEIEAAQHGAAPVSPALLDRLEGTLAGVVQLTEHPVATHR